jgi:hypothetical protein
MASGNLPSGYSFPAHTTARDASSVGPSDSSAIEVSGLPDAHDPDRPGEATGVATAATGKRLRRRIGGDAPTRDASDLAPDPLVGPTGDFADPADDGDGEPASGADPAAKGRRAGTPD